MNNVSLLAAALLSAAAVTAQAGELYTPQYQDPASTMTRAQVRQSVLQARQAGELAHDDVDLPTQPTPAFGRTRAQVSGEVLAARANGELGHDDVDQPGVAQATPTRREVRAEAIASRRSVRTAPGRNTIDY